MTWDKSTQWLARFTSFFGCLRVVREYRPVSDSARVSLRQFENIVSRLYTLNHTCAGCPRARRQGGLVVLGLRVCLVRCFLMGLLAGSDRPQSFVGFFSHPDTAQRKRHWWSLLDDDDGHRVFRIYGGTVAVFVQLISLLHLKSAQTNTKRCVCVRLIICVFVCDVCALTSLPLSERSNGTTRLMGALLGIRLGLLMVWCFCCWLMVEALNLWAQWSL